MGRWVLHPATPWSLGDPQAPNIEMDQELELKSAHDIECGDEDESSTKWETVTFL